MNLEQWTKEKLKGKVSKKDINLAFDLLLVKMVMSRMMLMKDTYKFPEINRINIKQKYD